MICLTGQLSKSLRPSEKYIFCNVTMSADCPVPASSPSFALSPPCQAPIVNLQPSLSRETTRTLSPPRVSDIVISQPGQNDSIAQLLEESRQKILDIRQRKYQTLITTMSRNRVLLYNLLHVLKTMYHLTPRMNRFYIRFFKIKKPSYKMIKRICQGLVVRGLIDPTWLKKPPIDFAMSLKNTKPMLKVKLNDISTVAVLDTGRACSFVPYAIWTRLRLHPNALDIPVTSQNHDALGFAELLISIRNDTKKYQVIKHKCLLLKQTSRFVYAHLADDFLLLNSASMSYSISPPLTKLNGQTVPLLSKTAALNLVPPESYLVNGSDPLFQASASPGLCDHSPAASQLSHITGANLARSDSHAGCPAQTNFESSLCNQFALFASLEQK